MAIDQTRQHRHRREIDDRGAGGKRQVAAHSFDLRTFDQNDLIAQDRPAAGVNQPARLDRGDLRLRRRRAQRHQEERGQQVSFHLE